MTASSTVVDIGEIVTGSVSEPVALPIGSVAPNFAGLPGVDGRSYSLGDFDKRQIVVLIFLGNRCPTATAYADRMNALQRDYGPRGVQLIAINSNDPHMYPDEDFERMVHRARESGYQFPYLADPSQHLAREMGPTRTFEIFVLDRDRRIRYHGRFDDSRLPERVTSTDLANALDDILAGREVRVSKTRAFGCSLDLR